MSGSSVSLDVRLLHAIGDMEQLLEVFGRVWGLPTGQGFVSADVLKAMEHAGCYVAAAYDDGEMVGGSMGFRGVHRGAPSLHSHVTGVVPGRQHAGLGRAVKQHQRMWAMSHGIRFVTWTFDPLVRRNAWFNLQRLGVTCDEYLVDFYGPLRDEINGNDETDRLLAVWEVAGSRAIAAADHELTALSSDDLVDAGAQRLLVVDAQGAPAVSDVSPSAGRTLLVAVPDDIVPIRRADAGRPPADGLAHAWRRAVRATLGHAVQSGYVVTDLTADGSYVLRRH